MKKIDSKKEKEFGISWIDRLVAENDDVIEINSDKIKRAYYDTDDILKFEYADGSIGKVADADLDTIQNAAKDWESAYPDKTHTIVLEYCFGKPIIHHKKA